MSSSNNDKLLDQVMEWVTSRLAVNDVPRVSDVVTYAHTEMGFKQLKKAAIARRLRLHPAYMMNSFQTKATVPRANNFRPILANHLGVLHADLGYFAAKRGVETPKDFRSGFLVAKDVLSRFIYAVVIVKNKSAESMIRAFVKLFEKHREFYGPEGHAISSIGFDRETSVMSNKVQDFLRNNGIRFFAFHMSSSKAKGAERAIGQIRTVKDRLERAAGKPLKWWKILQTCVDILNSQEIRLKSAGGLGYAPRDVNLSNLDDFLQRVYKADKAAFFNQFDLAPDLVKFKYPIGTFVRPKLLVTSSAVIGVKRSEVTLDDTVYAVLKHIPYNTHGHFVGKAYECLNVSSSTGVAVVNRQKYKETEIFDERDIVETLDV